MVTRPLFVLAEFHFTLGLIDVAEFEERINVAHWLATDGPDAPDPREPSVGDTPDANRPQESTQGESEPRGARPVGVDDPDWLELVVLKRWYFTRSDPDPYPSIPHGHLSSANRAWPKLNPYTGRAFKAKHQEDGQLRLSKSDMRTIWGDQAFRDFCRSHIVWYMEAHPHHVFAVRHPLSFPRW